MINFLRSNQPFSFVISGCFILLLVLPAGYFKEHIPDIEYPYKFLIPIPKIVYQLFLLAILFFTSSQINRIVNQSVLFSKSYYVPGLIYLILMCFYCPVEYNFLPVISNFFIVMAMKQFFKIFRNEPCRNLIFNASSWLIISCFFLPVNVLLIPIVWLILLIIRPFEWREYIMPLVVLIAVGLYIVPFGLINGELNNWLAAWWELSYCQNYWPNKHIRILYLFFLAFSLLFSINPISKTFIRSSNRYKKITWVLISMLFFTATIGAVSFLFFKITTPLVFSFFIPISILISNGIITVKRKWLVDLLFVLFVFGLVLTTYLAG